MRSLLERLKPSYPEVALLLEPPCALGMRVVRERGGASAVSWFEEPLEWGPEGPDAPSLSRLADRALTALGGPSRLSVVLDDAHFRCQVASIGDFPAQEEERLQVLRWHARKMLDCELDDLRLSYQVLGRSPAGSTVWLSLASERFCAAVEEAFAAHGAHVGFLGAETPELFNYACAGGLLAAEGVTLLVNRTRRSLSFLFAEDGVVRFFRSKALPAEVEAPEEEEQQLLQEIRLTLAFQRDRLGGAPLNQIWWRTSERGLSLPILEEVPPGVEVRELVGVGGAPGGCGGREALATPLFRIVKG